MLLCSLCIIILISPGRRDRDTRLRQHDPRCWQIRQALEQFDPERPGANKAPDNISGIALNPNRNPLFISREIILQILELEKAAGKKSENKVN